MKHSTIIFCVLLVITVGTQFIPAQTTSTKEFPEGVQTAQTEYTNDGIFFNALSVVDNVWYGTAKDGAWYLIYDDADAGMSYEAIRVTKATYFKVVEAIENKQELCGRLYAIQEYEAVEYELRIEDELKK